MLNPITRTWKALFRKPEKKEEPKAVAVEAKPGRKYHPKPVRRSKTGLTPGAFGKPKIMRRNRE